jgi:hypothetical protein
VTALLSIEDVGAFAATRASWHMLAEHVLAKARWVATQRIGLRAAPGGFATPHFGDDRRALVIIDTVVREQYGLAEPAAITTVRAAAAWIDVEPGVTAAMGPATTPLELDAPLPIAAGAARVLASWYGFADAVLADWRSLHGDSSPSLVQLWPEHFDLALDLGDEEHATRAGYGASPGDDAIAGPYLYVSPWDKAHVDARDGFWNQPFGAALGYDQLLAAPDPAAAAHAFFAHAKLRVDERDAGQSSGGRRPSSA